MRRFPTFLASCMCCLGGCLDAGDAPTNSAGEAPSAPPLARSQGMDGSPPRAFGAPTVGMDPGLRMEGTSTELQVPSGRVDGQFGSYQVHGRTQDNFGWLDTWGPGPQESYLSVTFAAQTDTGMAMMIIDLGGGFGHPLFESGVVSVGPGQPGQYGSDVLVTGCSGPDLENVDWDVTAGQFEVHVSESDEIENAIRFDVDAVFVEELYDDWGQVVDVGEPQHATGSVTVMRPAM